MAETIVNPTEDETKVERALRNMFPSASIERTSEADDVVRLTVRGEDLEFLSNLRNLIRRERIRNAARSILHSRTLGQRMRFYLNKQAAFAGRISFCEAFRESPHGPISVEIESDDAQLVIDFLAAEPSQKTYQRIMESRRRYPYP